MAPGSLRRHGLGVRRIPLTSRPRTVTVVRPLRLSSIKRAGMEAASPRPVLRPCEHGTDHGLCLWALAPPPLWPGVKSYSLLSAHCSFPPNPPRGPSSVGPSRKKYQAAVGTTRGCRGEGTHQHALQCCPALDRECLGSLVVSPWGLGPLLVHTVLRSLQAHV